jgi:mannosyl-3-phosphoglycerate phosphatase family protein
MSEPAPIFLVFSDLDGSLLDHHSYSFSAAMPMVATLDRLNIPLILASSKTRSEMLELRAALGNKHPFIVENGAAIFIPKEYFPSQPDDTKLNDNYWVHEMAPQRSTWLQVLATLAEDFPGEFDSFSRAGITGIMAMTGLPKSAAIAANDRLYSEPVKWLGSPQREATFIDRLQTAGAAVARGGRFLAVSGSCSKGQALLWLRAQYRSVTPTAAVHDLAIGDSDNDRPMLEAAETALLIRSPVHDYPLLTKRDAVIHSREPGPTGWAEGVSYWLQCNGILL